MIIGVGHRHRGDDAAGLIAVDALRDLGFATIEHCGEGLGLIGAWDGAEVVVLIDAMRSSAPCGTVRRLEPLDDGLNPDGCRCSSHLFGVGQAVALARELDRLPARLIVYGIEGMNFAIGAPVSDPVRSAVSDVVDRIVGELLGGDGSRNAVCTSMCEG